MQIMVLRCETCGAFDPGPRDLCVSCHGPHLAATEVPGAGSLVSWTTIRRPPTRFKGQAPYIVAVVKLASGPIITGRFDGPVDRLKLNLPVQAVSAKSGTHTFVERTG